MCGHWHLFLLNVVKIDGYSYGNEAQEVQPFYREADWHTKALRWYLH
jgi:hypothetical protein